MGDIVRIYLREDTCIMEDVQEALDDNYISYDWDSGDRLMIDEDDLEEVEEILQSIGAGYDII